MVTQLRSLRMSTMNVDPLSTVHRLLITRLGVITPSAVSGTLHSALINPRSHIAMEDAQVIQNGVPVFTKNPKVLLSPVPLSHWHPPCTLACSRRLFQTQPSIKNNLSAWRCSLFARPCVHPQRPTALQPCTLVTFAQAPYSRPPEHRESALPLSLTTFVAVA